MKIRTILSTAMAVLSLGLAGCSSGARDNDKPNTDGSPTTLRIGYQLIPNGDLIVKDQKWLELALPHTTITWSKFDSGGDVNTAMIAGSIDIGLAGSSPVAKGLSPPLSIKYKVGWIFDVIGDNEGLVARGAGSVKDLKGKKIATPFSSTSHYSLLAALQEAGLTESDVKLLDMEPPDIQAAWSRQDIDAAYVWTPNLAQLQKDGKTLVTSGELAKRGKLTADLGVVRIAFADKYPKAVQAWLAQEDRAVKFVRKDKSAAAEAVARQLNIAPAEASRQLDQLILLDAQQQAGPDYLGTPTKPGAFAQNLLSAAEFLAAHGKIPGVPPLSAFQGNLATKELAQAVRP